MSVDGHLKNFSNKINIQTKVKIKKNITGYEGLLVDQVVKGKKGG